MPKTLGRNLHMCFSKIKRPLAPESPPHPLTPDDHSRPFPTTTTSFLIKNFNSLYDLTSKSLTHSSSSSSDLSSSETDTETTTPADFATVYASQRFFFSSPGRSNSIIESSSSLETPPESNTLVNGSIAIRTYSPDPYMDFRRSMQEMVEARELMDVRTNWDNLHELLLCYLALNPKSTHKFIVSAFADLIVGLMSSPEGGSRKDDISGGSCTVKGSVHVM
ncbi:hypothetical protein L1049_005311 [Liquidambar formosana]|uniref:Transcription repressor n=1 Tax=Liquidambar formosana TaxID=63359 RepID=A0AAP0RV72_LIQFO